MASAIKCDRCKTYYEKNQYRGEKLFNYLKNKDDAFHKLEIVTHCRNGYRYDLCDDCLELLDMFLLNKDLRIYKGVR